MFLGTVFHEWQSRYLVQSMKVDCFYPSDLKKEVNSATESNFNACPSLSKLVYIYKAIQIVTCRLVKPKDTIPSQQSYPIGPVTTVSVLITSRARMLGGNPSCYRALTFDYFVTNPSEVVIIFLSRIFHQNSHLKSFQVDQFTIR